MAICFCVWCVQGSEVGDFSGVKITEANAEPGEHTTKWEEVVPNPKEVGDTPN